jgi:hypothetical protein
VTFYPVRMGALTINGTPDANGDVFVVGEIDGLWGPDVDLQETLRTDMGARLDVWRYKSLTFTLKGTAYSRTNADFDVLRIINKLNVNSFPTGALSTLYIDQVTPYPALQVQVVRSGKLHLPKPVHNVQTFEIDFTAPDPRKYSQAVQTVFIAGGTWPDAVNAGDVDTFATATLTNTSTDPYLEHSVQGRITLPGSIPAGTVVSFGAKETIHPTSGVIEMASRPRVWWTLNPGVNTIRTNVQWRIDWLNSWI